MLPVNFNFQFQTLFSWAIVTNSSTHSSSQKPLPAKLKFISPELNFATKTLVRSFFGFNFTQIDSFSKTLQRLISIDSIVMGFAFLRRKCTLNHIHSITFRSDTKCNFLVFFFFSFELNIFNENNNILGKKRNLWQRDWNKSRKMTKGDQLTRNLWFVVQALALRLNTFSWKSFLLKED